MIISRLLLGFPVQAPVLDRLGNMLFKNGGAPVKIGDGTRHLEDAGIRTGGESEAVGNQFQHAVTTGIQFAVFFYEAGRHLGVAVNFGTFVAFHLEFPRPLDPAGNGSRTLRLAPIGKIAIFYRRDLDVDIDPVQQRPGNAGTVAVNGNRSAGAGMGWVRKIAAGAGVC